MPETQEKTPKVYRPADPATQVFTTTDYDKFHRLPGNRPLIPGHVLQLVNSMREHDLLVPVIVNEKMQIIDGQHRVEARRTLGLPVPYIQSSGMTLSDVQKINSTSKVWTHDDYARSYIEQGNQHYKTYAAFRTTYGLPHEVSMLLLSGRGSKATRGDFIKGEFRIHDLEGARTMANLLHTHIRAVWPAGWRDSQFVRALYIANARLGFEMGRFLSVMPSQRHQLFIYRSVDQYLLMIENIYNSVPGRTKIAIRYGQTAVAGQKGAHGAMSDAKRKSMPAKRMFPPRKPGESTLEDKVMAFMKDGKTRDFSEIKSLSGIDDSKKLSNCLGRLMRSHTLTRVSNGVYELKRAESERQ